MGFLEGEHSRQRAQRAKARRWECAWEHKAGRPEWLPGTTGGDRGEKRGEESRLDRKLTCLLHGLLVKAAPLHLPPTSPDDDDDDDDGRDRARAGAQTDLPLVLTPNPQQLCAVLLLELGHLGLELQLQPPLQVAQLGLLPPAQPARLILTAPLQLRLLSLQLLALRRMEGWGQGERHLKNWPGCTESAAAPTSTTSRWT